jgi:hypothetical protein
MRDEDLWDMSDADLEAAFKEAQAAEDSPVTDIEAEASEEEFVESEPSMEETDVTNDEDVALDDEATDIDDGPEQLEDDDLEDSGHDTSDESETDEVAEEDQADAEEDDPDGDSEAEEDADSEDTEDDEEEEQPAQTYKFKANGKDYEFSSDEIVDQFPKIFGQAMDYTKKMQAIKPWRKTIDAIEGAELGHDDISLMIDVLKGDKNAITEVLKRTGTDTLELDTEADSNYVAKDYGRDDSALAIKDIVDDISRDQEYATTHNILSKEWDDRSWATMAQNPEMIRLLHTDVKSGMYTTLQPLAEKLKVYDGGKKSDLDYYKEAAQQHFNQVAEQEAYEERQAQRQAEREAKQAEAARLEEVKAKSQKRTATKQASAKRKAAAPTKAPAANRDVIDYLDDSDEAFDEWYKRLQDDM